TLEASFLGIPLREWTVNVLPDTMLYPGGELIGVRIDSKGLIAYKYEDIGEIPSPAKKANVHIGDIIQKLNGVETNNAVEFREKLNEVAPDGKMVRLTVIRDASLIDIMVSPAYSDKEQKWLIGLYIKDDIAGIGTLTYLNEDRSYFGALGHAIAEVKSGVTVPINKGELKGAQVISLVKGERNEPGAIHGIIAKKDDYFGFISANNNFGIFGTYQGGLMDATKKPMPIALQGEVKTGPATILTTLGDKAKEYDIRINKVNQQAYPNTKSMVIQIVDPELLEKTGGIIQGMSGSPILQNGKIVGAVTHVMVNDPKMGYGVFIEWMLQNHMQ
ncbi:MAG: SpoIVB peptidase, partial [Eubacteriaceae bacterium]|nr:SpoIVB peptidase [Eubacteriaceae bacterium]